MRGIKRTINFQGEVLSDEKELSEHSPRKLKVTVDGDEEQQPAKMIILNLWKGSKAVPIRSNQGPKLKY